MNEVKHTPGPWFVIDLRESYMRKLGWTGPSIDRILITNKIGAEIEGSDDAGSVIARIQFDNRPDALTDGNLADARLIAAAPDMLELIKAAIPLISDCGPRQGDWHDRARAAIAKAEGRAS